MRLIWVDAKAEYFCAEGLTRFLKIRSDLPVVLILSQTLCGICACAASKSARSARIVGWAKARSAVPTNLRRCSWWRARFALPNPTRYSGPQPHQGKQSRWLARTCARI